MLFKIDPVVLATHRQYLILVLSLALYWLRFTFVLNTLNTHKITLLKMIRAEWSFTKRKTG
jgi:hypothetical protein